MSSVVGSFLARHGCEPLDQDRVALERSSLVAWIAGQVLTGEERGAARMKREYAQLESQSAQMDQEVEVALTALRRLEGKQEDEHDDSDDVWQRVRLCGMFTEQQNEVLSGLTTRVGAAPRACSGCVETPMHTAVETLKDSLVFRYHEEVTNHAVEHVATADRDLPVHGFLSTALAAGGPEDTGLTDFGRLTTTNPSQLLSMLADAVTAAAGAGPGNEDKENLKGRDTRVTRTAQKAVARAKVQELQHQHVQRFVETQQLYQRATALLQESTAMSADSNESKRARAPAGGKSVLLAEAKLAMLQSGLEVARGLEAEMRCLLAAGEDEKAALRQVEAEVKCFDVQATIRRRLIGALVSSSGAFVKGLPQRRKALTLLSANNNHRNHVLSTKAKDNDNDLGEELGYMEGLDLMEQVQLVDLVGQRATSGRRQCVSELAIHRTRRAGRKLHQRRPPAGKGTPGVVMEEADSLRPLLHVLQLSEATARRTQHSYVTAEQVVNRVAQREEQVQEKLEREGRCGRSLKAALKLDDNHLGDELSDAGAWTAQADALAQTASKMEHEDQQLLTLARELQQRATSLDQGSTGEELRGAMHDWVHQPAQFAAEKVTRLRVTEPGAATRDRFTLTEARAALGLAGTAAPRQ